MGLSAPAWLTDFEVAEQEQARQPVVAPLPEIRAGSRIEWDVKTPAGEAVILRHVSQTRALGLPKFDADRPTLRIVASGPSALAAPLTGQTLAVNGGLSLFTRQGLAPTYWAACDPQELVVGFLEDAPKETTYLLASKCHPAVFERLKGYDVRTWDVGDFVHEADTVPCASTITSTAIALMLRLGFSKFEVWGWDCCYGADGSHHVTGQGLPDQDLITIECDGRDFLTRRSWCLEAEDFANKLKPIYDYLGVTVAIEGDGFLRAFVEGSGASLKFDAAPTPLAQLCATS